MLSRPAGNARPANSALSLVGWAYSPTVSPYDLAGNGGRVRPPYKIQPAFYLPSEKDCAVEIPALNSTNPSSTKSENIKTVMLSR